LRITFLLLVFACELPAATPTSTSWAVANIGLLPLLSPMGLKQADPVPEFRNPMRVALVKAPSDPLKGVYKEKSTETSKLRARVGDRIKSVIRGESVLVAIDNRFYRIGDEILLVDAGKTEQPLPGTRVYLTKVGDSSLTFSVQSTDADGQSPWQTEVEVPLPSFLRRQ
ncbi:MAG: hypothetical protein ABI273_05325, partial [Lacunisphaera sp.]